MCLDLKRARPERPKGAKEKVKGPEGPLARSRVPEGPPRLLYFIIICCVLCKYVACCRLSQVVCRPRPTRICLVSRFQRALSGFLDNKHHKIESFKITLISLKKGTYISRNRFGVSWVECPFRKANSFLCLLKSYYLLCQKLFTSSMQIRANNANKQT